MANQEILIATSFLIKAMALRAEIDMALRGEKVDYGAINSNIEEMRRLAENCNDFVGPY